MNTVLPFIIIILLVLANGMFVAAEFAIIGVRRTRIEYLAKEGNRTAKWVSHILEDSNRTDRYIATAQLGITLASLGLGMYAEPSIAHLIEAPLEHWFGLEGAIVHTISFIIALTFITYLHVVVGEMVPKSMALQDAEQTVLLLASPMQFFGKFFSIPVTVLNNIGLGMLKLLRIPPPDKSSHLYGPDELELIVSESYAGGLLSEYEQELVINIFDFTERRVVQVMTPRTSINAIPVDINTDELYRVAEESPHSRLPVYEGSIEHIIGIIHLKDIVRQHLAGEDINLRALLRQVQFVPETVYVEVLLASFKRLRLHLAIVIDEFGSVVGLVTLEDLIEEVFGEMYDEFDPDHEQPLVVVEPGHLSAQGTVSLADVEQHVDFGEHKYDVQTVGGLAMAGLGRPPEEGDEVTINSATLRVESVDGLTVQKVSVHYPQQQDESAEQAPSEPDNKDTPGKKH